jgi:hypothetical protein
VVRVSTDPCLASQAVQWRTHHPGGNCSCLPPGCGVDRAWIYDYSIPSSVPFTPRGRLSLPGLVDCPPPRYYRYQTPQGAWHWSMGSSPLLRPARDTGCGKYCLINRPSGACEPEAMSSQFDCGNNPNAANCRWDYGTHSAFPYPLFLCLR